MIAKPLSKRDLDVGCVLPVPNDRVVSSTEVTHPKGFSQMRVASRWTTGCVWAWLTVFFLRQRLEEMADEGQVENFKRCRLR